MSDTSTALAHLVDAPQAELPAARPKPTSLTGQEESLLVLWAADRDGAEAGIWECEPGTFTAVRDGFHEICQILTGRATVRGEDGGVVELVPGSTVVLPDGWRGTWEVHETMRKTYVTVATR
ncbi:cupin domain-containing protein [Microtetraspora sp. NBRC 16547]|uniref:cupin domain-containing protein n=1 Tax=Microtetraspora sp. NBRC 16547 TaxID=3030993 RepID=UPI0024A3AA62|nr:cupin domain-containing protein [Microtetraspora sp. NBRC 16547]GLW96109.1 cupin [Microtetraspora sp. NBRC 16547]